MMHQRIKPQVRTPTANAAIHPLTHKSMISGVWLVTSRCVGNQPRRTSSEHPVNNNAPTVPRPVALAILARRLPVRTCELTDGPSSLFRASDGAMAEQSPGLISSFTTHCRAYPHT